MIQETEANRSINNSIGRGIEVCEKQEVGGFGHEAGISKRKTRYVGLWMMEIISIDLGIIFFFFFFFRFILNDR